LEGWTIPRPSWQSRSYLDPAAGFWSPTGSLSTPRFDALATLLPNGKVLCMGGHDTNSILPTSAELTILR
jgi:hypothetical protein